VQVLNECYSEVPEGTFSGKDFGWKFVGVILRFMIMW